VPSRRPSARLSPDARFCRANDGYCDDTRTSSLCDLGTDCKDCGPASAGNFTTWDDDGWWDEPSDDEPHVAFIKSTRNPRTRNKDMNENKVRVLLCFFVFGSLLRLPRFV
jgi:hypothetical protein